MSDTERDQIRQDRMMEHIEDLAESHKVEEDMAIATTYHMSPEDFKERMDEMLWFLRLRSTLTELDRLLEIAMDLEKHLKGRSYLEAREPALMASPRKLLTRTGDITETYPTYLETLTDDTLDRLVNATNNLSRTARSTRFHRKLQLAGQYTNVGATENRVRAICDLQINRLVKNMPDDPKEWIDLDSEQFEFVWEKVEALQQAVQGWKPDSDQELQTLRDELSSIWKIAANFDRDELIQYGLQGV
ncbi:MAG: hypothetical protein LQ349_000510 [Xanthoria aureola]|nr:MAG: hypothetical protein LQ349_000510 [Xanthoria aureola]